MGLALHTSWHCTHRLPLFAFLFALAVHLFFAPRHAQLERDVHRRRCRRRRRIYIYMYTYSISFACDEPLGCDQPTDWLLLTILFNDDGESAASHGLALECRQSNTAGMLKKSF